jgi:hypothetical protein
MPTAGSPRSSGWPTSSRSEPRRADAMESSSSRATDVRDLLVRGGRRRARCRSGPVARRPGPTPSRSSSGGTRTEITPSSSSPAISGPSAFVDMPLDGERAWTCGSSRGSGRRPSCSTASRRRGGAEPRPELQRLRAQDRVDRVRPRQRRSGVTAARGRGAGLAARASCWSGPHATRSCGCRPCTGCRSRYTEVTLLGGSELRRADGPPHASRRPRWRPAPRHVGAGHDAAPRLGRRPVEGGRPGFNMFNWVACTATTWRPGG